ncbi:MAG: hypothetical protein ACLFQV_12480 [Vulcanimicrobiota bacterium]
MNILKYTNVFILSLLTLGILVCLLYEIYYHFKKEKRGFSYGRTTRNQVDETSRIIGVEYEYTVGNVSYLSSEKIKERLLHPGLTTWIP